MKKLLAVLVVFAFVLGAVAPVLADEVTLTGTVKKVEEDCVIVADDGEYKAACEELLDMDGKLVKVTGTVVEADGVKTITITGVEEAK